MADDLHNIPDHRGIASSGGNWASRRRREVAKNARHATRIGRRFQVPMSSVRQNPIFRWRREKRTNPTSDSASLRKMIMVDAGGGLGERQGAGFRSSDDFCWSRLVAKALLQSRDASSEIARCPMPTEPSRIQPLAKQWLSASRCLSK